MNMIKPRGTANRLKVKAAPAILQAAACCRAQFPRFVIGRQRGRVRSRQQRQLIADSSSGKWSVSLLPLQPTTAADSVTDNYVQLPSSLLS